VSTAVRSAFDWAFRDRRTGRIVIAQVPNVPLIVWFAGSAIRWLVHPHRSWATALNLTTTIALVGWAILELLRGVNPWRRGLGAAVLGAVILGWVLG
jgi:hypothetical protein